MTELSNVAVASNVDNSAEVQVTKPRKKRIRPYYEDIQTIAKLDKLSVQDRIAYHTRRVQRSEKVYEKLDKLMLITLPMNQIKDQLSEVVARKELIEKCIALHSAPEFIQCRNIQKSLEQKILVEAVSRLDLFAAKPLPVESIKASLRQEDMMLDMLVSVELSLEKLCESIGVCASQFFIAGKLLARTRGITTQKFCREHMGYNT